MKRKNRPFKTRLITVLVTLIIIIPIAAFLYLNSYLKSEVSVQDYEKVNPNIKVSETEDGILLENKTSEDMLVFYPGARIQSSAYLPLLFDISESGIDCFITEMPYHMAIFDSDAFNKVKETYPEEHYFLMGHSLGGSMAANFIAKEKPEISGLILLAAYPTKDLKDTGIPLLSIYGSKDGILNMDKYEDNKSNWPDDSKEVVIQGANHAGFGNYGDQRGDELADIKAEEQQEKTAQEVINFIKQNTDK